jgi:hypothetical protein
MTWAPFDHAEPCSSASLNLTDSAGRVEEPIPTPSRIDDALDTIAGTVYATPRYYGVPAP